MKHIIIWLISLAIITSLTPGVSFASQSSIDRKSAEIRQIEQQLKAIESRKTETAQQKAAKEREATTLRSQISTLNTEISSLENELASVSGEITQKEETISITSGTIGELEQKLVEQKLGMQTLIRDLYMKSTFKNEIVTAVSSDNISQVFAEVEYSNAIQSKIEKAVIDIIAHKDWLEAEKQRLSTERASLASVQSQLEQKKVAIETTKNQTENKAYSSQVAANQLNASLDNLLNQESSLRAQMSRFYAELASLKSARTLSRADSPLGQIIWPTTARYCSQGYGMTRFAAQGWYGGAIHNGIDIAGSGPVFAVKEGVVIAKQQSPCGSGSSCGGGWGNWVAIRHQTGHVTLYAHLAGISPVSIGQSVSQGQTIGAIGNSGFSTGPHLHFSIYSSFGVGSSGTPSYPGVTLNPENYYSVSCWR